MKTTKPFPCILVIAAPAVALTLGACAGEKQLHSQAPIAAPAAALGHTNLQPIAKVANTPTASNVSISEEVLRACNLPDADAYFPFDSAHLTTFDRTSLDSLAKCFTSGPMSGRKMHLVGHADPRGAAQYNMTLGQSRADSVAAFLVAQGVARANATATSRGAMDATGLNETGWAHDRRVDVLLAN